MRVLLAFAFILCVIPDLGNACNSYGGYGYGGLFGDGYGYGHHRPVHIHHGYHGQYGHYGQGFGGFMDSLFRTDIGSSHGVHHHHRHTPLVPLSHHRHVHHVGRRSVHSRRSHTTST